jgi:hypothetical protein
MRDIAAEVAKVPDVIVDLVLLTIKIGALISKTISHTRQLCDSDIHHDV